MGRLAFILDSFLDADWQLLRRTWTLTSPGESAIPYLAGVDSHHDRAMFTQVLQRLIDAKAFACKLPGYRGTPEDTPMLVNLRELGILEVHEATDMAQDPRSHWFFSVGGLKRLSFGVELQAAKSIRIGDVRPNVPIGEMSSYELILKLQDEGWSWRFLSARARALSHDLIATPRELVWYSGMSVQRLYLRCLLQGPSLLEQYRIEYIPHHAKPATYQDILRGVAPQPEAAPVEDAECQAWLPDDKPRGVAIGSSVPQDGSHIEEQPAEYASAMDSESDGAADILVDEGLFGELFGGAVEQEANEQVEPGPRFEDHPPPVPAEASRRTTMVGRSFRWGCFLFTRKNGGIPSNMPLAQEEHHDRLQKYLEHRQGHGGGMHSAIEVLVCGGEEVEIAKRACLHAGPRRRTFGRDVRHDAGGS